MRHTVVGMVLAAVSALTCAPAHAQSWSVPPESQRCPSKWGAGDERGSGNHMKPAAVLEAAADQDRRDHRARARARTHDAVLRHAALRRAHQAHVHERPARTARGSNEEMVISEIGQVGTQFDGFAHQTTRTATTTASRPSEICARGRLHQARHREGRHADHPRRADRRRRASRACECSADTYEITVEDLQEALQAAEPDAAAGRRGHHPHRLGQALGQGQRALHEDLPGHRRRRGGVAGSARIRC